MNFLNFNQSGGFPLETEILNEMQKAWAIFKSLGAIVGDLAIISGCEVTGTTVSDGLVNINGELLEFRGGALQTKVIIVEVVTSLEFEDTNTREVVYTRYATFGVAANFYLWADFKTGFQTSLIPAALDLKEDKTTVEALIQRIEDLEARPLSNVPNGLIAIWGRPFNQIPADWQEYVPLRGRMPIGLGLSGADFDILGDYGGDKEQTLTEPQMPEHDHFVVSSEEQWGIPINGQPQRAITHRAADTGANAFDYALGAVDSDAKVANAGKTSPAGENEAFSIMNPHRVVLFIEYIG